MDIENKDTASLQVELKKCKELNSSLNDRLIKMTNDINMLRSKIERFNQLSPFRKMFYRFDRSLFEIYSKMK